MLNNMEKDNTDKRNPRFWSSKYWKNNNIIDTLKEVVEPDEVDVSSIKINETLSPLIWETEEKLKSDVRKALLLNAKRFIEFCGVENLNFHDIILVGSMANYNYNEYSDIDVHIILDFTEISENIDFVGDFFKLKKALWSDNTSVQVKGHDVEMYMQNTSESPQSSGTYSIMYDKWINKPIQKLINIDSSDVQLKAADFMNLIDDLENNLNNENFLKKYELIKDKIKKYRQTGLEKGGEFSTENLVFKILRNSGYIEKLLNLKNEYLSKELSLKEILDK